jgi:hypothetical protein
MIIVNNSPNAGLTGWLLRSLKRLGYNRERKNSPVESIVMTPVVLVAWGGVFGLLILLIILILTQ